MANGERLSTRSSPLASIPLPRDTASELKKKHCPGKVDGKKTLRWMDDSLRRESER